MPPNLCLLEIALFARWFFGDAQMSPRSLPEIAVGLFQPGTVDVTAPSPAANQTGALC
ncbi:MAG: hypothetical protein ACXV3D_07950 [Halobacteriota archaeon]